MTTYLQQQESVLAEAIEAAEQRSRRIVIAAFLIMLIVGSIIARVAIVATIRPISFVRRLLKFVAEMETVDASGSVGKYPAER